MNPALQSLLHTDGKFYVDNSRLETYTKCARHGQYSIVLKRRPSGVNMSFKLGEVCHLCLQYRYTYYGMGPVDSLGLFHIDQIITQFFTTFEIPADDYRTPTYCRNVMIRYLEEYPAESEHSIIQHANTPIVERSFAVKLGSVDGIDIVWIGRIDLGVEDMKGPWVFDHKTSKIGGANYGQEFTNSSQFKGYVFALRQALGLEVKGAIVNSLICREPTRTGKNLEFCRHKVQFDEDHLTEWRENTLQTISDFFYDVKRGYFPMQTTQCIGKYGKCHFFDTCSLAPAARQSWLMTGAFENDTFSPLKRRESEIDIHLIRKLTPTANWQTPAVQPVSIPPNDFSVNKLLTDILNQ